MSIRRNPLSARDKMMALTNSEAGSWSQQALAKALDLSGQQFVRYLHGASEIPSIVGDKIHAIWAEAYGPDTRRDEALVKALKVARPYLVAVKDDIRADTHDREDAEYDLTLLDEALAEAEAQQ